MRENSNVKSHFYAFQNDHPVEIPFCCGSLQVQSRQLTLVKCVLPTRHLYTLDSIGQKSWGGALCYVTIYNVNRAEIGLFRHCECLLIIEGPLVSPSRASRCQNLGSLGQGHAQKGNTVFFVEFLFFFIT